MAMLAPLDREQWANIAPILTDTVDSLMQQVLKLTAQLTALQRGVSQADQTSGQQIASLQAQFSKMSAQTADVQQRTSTLEVTVENQVNSRLSALESGLTSNTAKLQHDVDTVSDALDLEVKERHTSEEKLNNDLCNRIDEVRDGHHDRLHKIEVAIKDGELLTDFARTLSQHGERLASAEVEVETLRDLRVKVDKQAALIREQQDLQKASAKADTQLRSDIEAMQRQTMESMERKTRIIVTEAIQKSEQETDKKIAAEHGLIVDLQNKHVHTSSHLADLQEVVDAFEAHLADRANSAELLRDRLMSEARERERLATRTKKNKEDIDARMDEAVAEQIRIMQSLTAVNNQTQENFNKIQDNMKNMEISIKLTEERLIEQLEELTEAPGARLTEARFYALEKRMQVEEDDRIENMVVLNTNMATVSENMEQVPKMLARKADKQSLRKIDKLAKVAESLQQILPTVAAAAGEGPIPMPVSVMPRPKSQAMPVTVSSPRMRTARGSIVREPKQMSSGDLDLQLGPMPTMPSPAAAHTPPSTAPSFTHNLPYDADYDAFSPSVPPLQVDEDTLHSFASPVVQATLDGIGASRMQAPMPDLSPDTDDMARTRNEIFGSGEPVRKTAPLRLNVVPTAAVASPLSAFPQAKLGASLQSPRYVGSPRKAPLAHSHNKELVTISEDDLAIRAASTRLHNKARPGTSGAAL
eukprot:TRINITY_DN3392_c0_g3_i1.p1 TRINITY_DN3392_c0_g3~~TRINITY_DN3392_c0_g3_i1.p1  ORF type:complete len:701 (+),score=209.68 TRINITY_DN3392_c0_g3_i1:106-2208(+)